jgi:hypothetical protein
MLVVRQLVSAALKIVDYRPRYYASVEYLTTKSAIKLSGSESRSAGIVESDASFAQLRSKSFEIFHAGVTHDSDNSRVRSQLFCQSQSGDDIGARGSPRKKAFLSRQPKGHGHRFFRRNPFNPVGDILPAERHDITRSHTINFMAWFEKISQSGVVEIGLAGI